MSQLFEWGGQSIGSFSFNISPSNEHPGLISFRIDWMDRLAVQGTLKSLLQHHSSKASNLRHSAFFAVQLSHPYMTIGKTIALTTQTFVGKVMSLLLNMLSRLVINFFPRSRHLKFHGCNHHLQWFWSPKKFDCMHHNKLWKTKKRLEYQTTFPASWETYMWVKKQQLEPYMKQQMVQERDRSKSRMYIVTLLIQLLCRVHHAATKLKDAYSFEEKLWQT